MKPPVVKKVGAVIFDWAGTTVDFGSLAPVRTLQRVFKDIGIELSEAEARQDMGLAKRNHIAAILRLPRVAEEWARIRGKTADDCDVEDVYQAFLPLQLACLTEYSSVISGVPAVVEEIRRRGLKIGSTTGYTRTMLDILVEHAAPQGYKPDCGLTPEDVGAGRPCPYMIYETAVRLKVYPLSAIVKVGDTVSDIEEARNAGAWAVGVARTGNMVGLSEADLAGMPLLEQQQLVARARRALQAAGADYVIDTLAELPSVLDSIEGSLWERPSARAK